MSKSASVSLLVCLVFISCATQRNEDVTFFDRAPVFGMIYDEENQPCAGATLTVDGEAGGGRTGLVTDIRGRFVIPDLRRGDHAIVAQKEGYEELSVRIQFLNRTDVLFLRMISFGQLLANAEKALEERRWDQAEAYFERAGKIDPVDSVLLSLRAVASYKTERYGDAVNYLNTILAQGAKEPAVFLFLADIYEKHLNEPQKAIQSLEAYLERRADAEVERRLAAIKAGE